MLNPNSHSLGRFPEVDSFSVQHKVAVVCPLLETCDATDGQSVNNMFRARVLRFKSDVSC